MRSCHVYLLPMILLPACLGACQADATTNMASHRLTGNTKTESSKEPALSIASSTAQLPIANGVEVYFVSELLLDPKILMFRLIRRNPLTLLGALGEPITGQGLRELAQNAPLKDQAYAIDVGPLQNLNASDIINILRLFSDIQRDSPVKIYLKADQK